MSKGRGMTLRPGAGMLTVTWFLQGPGRPKSRGQVSARQCGLGP